MDATNTGQGLPEQTRVLLVEDHELLAEATAEFLRGHGLEVRVALTGREALASAVAFRPDMVLCDLSIPDIAAVDIASALRSDPVTSSVLFVIHTAHRTADIGSVRDVDVVLSKPLTADKLERLRELLRGAAASKRSQEPSGAR